METGRIPRYLDQLELANRPRRVTVIHGPRRVGKTNLVERYLRRQEQRCLSVNGDDITVRNLLASQNTADLVAWSAGYDIVSIDEAQRIPNVGWALKILIDARPELTIIATGSASFALAGSLGEPLTGRQTPLTIYPISIGELTQQANDYEIKQNLINYLIYGMYPEVRTAQYPHEQRRIVSELASSYLFRDILELERIKSAKLLVDLLRLIALQIGNPVSHNELGAQLGIDRKTVARYLDLFEKSYVLFNLRGFSRNLRNEVTKASKYFFYDTGIRNAVINNFNDIDQRNDIGALWENFMIMERIKALKYSDLAGAVFFWRNWEQQEIDLIEDRDGQLHAYEFKWSPTAKVRAPRAFLNAYPEAKFEVVDRDSFLTNLRSAATTPPSIQR